MPFYLGKDLLVGPMGAGGNSTRRMPGNNIVAAAGDSRTSQMLSSGDFRNAGFGLTHARQLLMGQYDVRHALIFGTGGYTAAQVRSTHYPSAKASAAKILFLLCGTNNGNSAGAGATAFADIEWMVNDWVDSAADRVVYVLDESPNTGFGTNAEQIILRDLIRTLKDWARGIFVLPYWRTVTGGNDGYVPLADAYSDAIHPTVTMANRVGRMIAAYLEGRVAEIDFFGRSIAGGGNFVGASPAAAGITTATGGVTSGSVAFSMVEEDGLNWIKAACSSVLGTFDIYPTSATTPGYVTPGTTTIESSMRYRIRPDLTLHAPGAARNGQGIRLMQFYARKQSGVFLAGNDMVHPGSGSDSTNLGLLVDQDIEGIMRTAPALVPGDATQLRPWNFTLSTRTSIPFTGDVLLALPQTVAS